MKYLNVFLILLLFLALGGMCPEITNAYWLPQIGGILIFTIAIGTYFLPLLGRIAFFSLSLLFAFIIPQITNFSSYEILLFILPSVLALTGYLSENEKEDLKKGIVLIALFETFIMFVQTAWPHLKLLRYAEGIPIATVGNSDFLATLIAVGLFLLLEIELPVRKKWLLLSLLFLGLLLTKSKGTIFLSVFLISYRYYPRLAVFGSLITGFSLLYILGEKLNGRLHLWQVAIQAAKLNDWHGYGFDNFGNVYFNTVDILMKDPSFKEKYTPWISEVSDAHNIFLQWLVELGILGLVAILVLIGFSIWRAEGATSGVKSSIFLIISKSVYTVVLKSTQGAFLWAVLLGLTTKSSREEKKSKYIIFLSISVLLFLIPNIITKIKADHDLHDGSRYLRLSLNESALESFNQGIANDSRSTDLLLAKSLALAESEKCDEAKQVIMDALQIKQNMDTYKRGGHILYLCSYYDEAQRVFLRLHSVFPEHRTTMMKLAWINYKNGKFSLAKRWAQKVIDTKPRRKSYSDARNLREAKQILDLTSF